MATTRGGSTRARLAIVAAATVFAATVWWLARDDAADAPPEALVAPAVAEDPAPTLPTPVGDGDATPLPLDVAAPDAPAPTSLAATDDASPPALDGPLVLDVRHGHGPPAARGEVAVYTVDDILLGHGELDAQGRWEHAGFDVSVEIYVLGVSAEFGRLSLPVGRGRHELVLPVGGWVAGQVLVEGAPPGRPLAVRVRGMQPAHELPDSGHGLPRFSPRGDDYRDNGKLFCAPDGAFLVSGFDAGAELRLGGPGGAYVRDESLCTPNPVKPPADDVLLALRRRPVIRGRVLHADGTPAPDADVQLSQELTRAIPPDTRYRTLGTQNIRNGKLLDDRGAFEVPLEDADGGCRCYDPATGVMLAEEACGPLVLAVSLRAAHSVGESVEVERPAERLDADVDLGDLWMSATSRHTLRVLDSDGAPIEQARLDPECSDDTRAWVVSMQARSDAEGLVTLDPADADLGAVTVSADGHEPVRVELPAVPFASPIDVVLPTATQLTLNVRWPEPWNEEDIGTWYVELRGVAPLLRSEVGRESTSGVPVGTPPRPRAKPGAAMRASSKYPGTPGEEVTLERKGNGSSITLDDLRADTPYALRLHSRTTRLEPAPGEPGDATYWQIEGVSLQRGEHRVLAVDLGALTVDPPGSGG